MRTLTEVRQAAHATQSDMARVKRLQKLADELPPARQHCTRRYCPNCEQNIHLAIARDGSRVWKCGCDPEMDDPTPDEMERVKAELRGKHFVERMKQNPETKYGGDGQPKTTDATSRKGSERSGA